MIRLTVWAWWSKNHTARKDLLPWVEDSSNRSLINCPVVLPRVMKERYSKVIRPVRLPSRPVVRPPARAR
jgi:hypothetical protein